MVFLPDVFLVECASLRSPQTGGGYVWGGVGTWWGVSLPAVSASAVACSLSRGQFLLTRSLSALAVVPPRHHVNRVRPVWELQTRPGSV